MFQTISDLFDPIPVVLSKSSMTVPDMSYTPREIISKFSRGEQVPLGFGGLYDSEDDGDNLGNENDPQIFQDDPTRDPTFDFGDYVEEKHALEERQKERVRRSKEKKSLDAKRKASAEKPSESEVPMRETTSEAAKDSPNAQA